MAILALLHNFNLRNLLLIKRWESFDSISSPLGVFSSVGEATSSLSCCEEMREGGRQTLADKNALTMRLCGSRERERERERPRSTSRHLTR